VFVSIGTSGSVYPAADFVRSVGRHARRVELNLEPPAGAPLFTERHYGFPWSICLTGYGGVAANTAKMVAQPLTPNTRHTGQKASKPTRYRLWVSASTG
jgi:hypothetical protein